MTNSLVIGLYPTAPTDDATFETFLHDLSIMAYQVDFDNPRTAPSPPKHIEIGKATYTNQADPKNTIYQLKKPVPFQPKKTMAAAAAVIPLPPSIDPRFLKPAYLVNVVLDVQRKGVHLVDHSINYDIQPADVTPPIDALDGVNVGLYLALTNPATDPGGPITYLVPPSDGAPPAYQDLDAAVKAILAEDPATKVDTADMSPADCLHIARELVSNRTPRPLPAPLVGSSADLGELYTASPTGPAPTRTVQSSRAPCWATPTSSATTRRGWPATSMPGRRRRNASSSAKPQPTRRCLCRYA